MRDALVSLYNISLRSSCRSTLGVRCMPLGVTDYGVPGSPEDLLREFKIDSDSIAKAFFIALGSESQS